MPKYRSPKFPKVAETCPLKRLRGFSARALAPALTYAWYDVEEVVDLLVHSRGDDLDLWESVGHRVDSHLCHQQGHQQDLVLLDVVVLDRDPRALRTQTKGDRLWISGLPPTSRTRTAIMAAAPVDTVQSIRMT